MEWIHSWSQMKEKVVGTLCETFWGTMISTTQNERNATTIKTRGNCRGIFIGFFPSNGTCWIFFFVMTRSSLIHFEIADFDGRSTGWTIPSNESLCCSSALVTLGLQSFLFSKYSMTSQNIGSRRTNQKLAKFPERSATLRNFVGFQTVVVKSVFAFLSFIGPFTKKVAILCSQLMLWLVNFVLSGPVQVVAL